MSIEITEDFINNIMHKENNLYESYSWNDYSPYPNLLTVIFENNMKLEEIKEEDSPKVKLDKIIDKIKNIDTPNLFLLSMSEWNQNEEIIKSLNLYIKQSSLKIKEYKFTEADVNYVTDKLYFEFTDENDENAIHIIDALAEIKKNIFESKEFFNKVDRVEGLWKDKEYKERIKYKLKIAAQNIIHTIYYEKGTYNIYFLYIDKRDILRITNRNYNFIKEYFGKNYIEKDNIENEKIIGINFKNYIFYDGNYGIEKFNTIPYSVKRGWASEILSSLMEYAPAEKISNEKFLDGCENDDDWKKNMDFINLEIKKYDGILNLLFPKDNFPQIRKWDAYIERNSINILNLILKEDIEAPELEGIKDEEEIIKIYLEKIKNRKDFFIPLQYLDRWTASEELVKKIPIYVKNNVQQIHSHYLYLERAEKDEKDAVHVIDKLKEAKNYYINKKEIEDLALAEGYYNDLEYREKFVDILKELGTKIKHTVYSYNIRWDEKDSFFIHNKDIKRMCAFKKFGFIKELFDDIDDYDIFMMENVYLNIASYKSYEKKWKFNEQDFEADEAIVKILIENRKGELKKW